MTYYNPDYDPNNVFAKILRGDLPCKKIFEDDVVLAFYDINPKSPIHALVIPKGEYRNFNDFCKNASTEIVDRFFKTVVKISQDLGLDENGFRVVANCGPNSGEEVPHFHIHLCGGARLRGFA